MNDASTRFSRSERLTNALLATWPFWVALGIVPSSVFLTNQSDFFYDAVILAPFLGVACLLFIAALRFSAFSAKIAGAGFFIGTFLLISDWVLPVRLATTIDNPERELADPQNWEIAGQAALLVVALICSWRLKLGRFRGMLAAMCGAVLLVSLGEFVVTLHRPRMEAPLKPQLADTAPSPKGNVYHLFVDAYSANVFQENLEELGLASSFRGFTFYPSARSNYVETVMSRASFMLGRMHKSGPINHFSAKDWRSAGITGAAAAAGYRIWSYASLYTWHPAHATVRSSAIDFRVGVALRAHIVGLTDLAAIRMSPVWWRKSVFSDHKGPLERWGVFGSPGFRYSVVTNFHNFDKMIDDEEQRQAAGEYVYAHVLHPHAPYVYDRECERIGETDYFEQSKCTTKLLAKFLNKLRELGRFDAATIVVHGDHGEWQVWPKSDRGRTEDSMPTYYTLNQKTRPLLAIKPPHSADQPLAVNEELVQLLDIAPTISALTGIPLDGMEGAPLTPTRREKLNRVEFYYGYYAIRSRLRSGVVDKLKHYTYRDDTKDVVGAPALRVFWDPKFLGED